MPIVNSIAALAPQMTAWRRHLHQHPELGLECHETAGFVVEQLKSFGITDIHTGIATSGVVAIIEGRGPGKTIGLRADMDALPMEDLSGTDHASTKPGLAHTCGHDGHTTMLLGAAKYLAETRNFAGRVALIFQPAEEGEGGGRIMVEEGIMDRFDISEVYGVHNAPGTALGHITTNPGALMAGVDEFTVTITGKGGHGAEPSRAVDPVVAAASLTMALQTIISRNINALDKLVVSVTQIHTGTAANIIPETAVMNGTVRYFDKAVQTEVKARMAELVEFQARSFGATAVLDYEEGYPPTINHPDQTAFAASVAREVVGDEAVDDAVDPIMPGEDFSYMLQARPGAYLFVGMGDRPNCHHPKYDFDDEIAPIGASFFARLIEKALPL
ncbi:M20 aminoacylase family protein [Tropicibacter naphthalenivorans]|uniref:Putative hydrolase YxeP n=1 Tax=Tropicibacter naphthalenivorans TaxID=441103 RepID=A0A0P1GF60_9RHOB|nr:M20 aminoacylase family protein [Tropicibacter naphthalenivorans]CUH80126.1 putative hydrolase YxeP [Tropicibacter naphthalenivorans]SMC84783.1 hippurate hydrolase [Tropicibacter naphthalenivorans]